MRLRNRMLIFALVLVLFHGSIPVNAAENIHTDNLSLNISNIILNVDDTYDLDMVGTDSEPYWNSYDMNKVYVDQDGVITGIRKGSTIVTARVGMVTKQCKVTVVDSSIKLNKKELTLYKGGTSVASAKLKATVKGANKEIQWESSDPEVAVVDAAGAVTAVKAGVAVITAEANGKTASCKVIVKNTSINLNVNTLTLSTKGAGSSIKLVPTVEGSNKKVKWTTSDKKIAVVKNGNVNGKNTGTAVIEATANGVSVSCNVIVNAGSISISEEKLLLYAGETKALKSNAAKTETPVWRSSDETVVTVDPAGKVQAVAAGEAFITVSMNDTSDTCKVEVKNIKTRIGQDKVELQTKGNDKTFQLGVQVTGKSNKVKWTSSDKKVVAVNNKGKLTAKKVGQARITATANGVSDTVEVKVLDYYPTIKLNHERYILYTGKGNKVALKATVVGPSKAVEWKSSDPSVLTVNKGIVVALKPGEAVITATANGVSEDCTIKVMKSEVILGTKDIYMGVGETCDVPVDIVGIAKKITYKTSDKKVVTISKGVAAAKNLGEATVTITANGASEEINVVVSDCKHEWAVTNSSYKTATCSENGLSLETCTLCNREKQVLKDTISCNFIEDIIVESTCTTNGTIISKCSNCNDTKQTIVKATGHKFSDWVVITKPSNFTEGIEKRYCDVCNYSESNIIPIRLNVDYDASTGELMADNTSYAKNSTVSIKFSNSNINSDKITGVMVNDELYSVELIEDVYSFEYKLPDTWGSHVLTMSKLMLEDSEVTLGNPRVLELTVLKDAPAMEDISVNKLSDYYGTLDFTLSDNDNVLKNAVLVVIKNGNIVGEYDVTAGKNSIRVELEPAVEYTAEVKAGYDLGAGAVYEAQVLSAKTFESPYKISDNITVSNFVIKNSEGNEIRKASKGEQIVLEFTIDDRMFNAVKAVVNSNEYVAETSNKVVTVTMTAPNSSLDICLESIKDGSENTAVISGDNRKHLVIVKAAPYVSDVIEEDAGDALNLSLTLNDAEAALDGDAVIKVYADDIEVQSEALKAGENNITIPITQNKNYAVKVIASYMLSDDAEDTYADQVIFEKIIKFGALLDFKDFKSVKLYNGDELVETLENVPANTDTYFLELEPINSPKLYVDVQAFELSEDGNKVYAVADLDGFVMYPSGEKTEELKYGVAYENSSSDTPIQLDSAQELFAAIKANRNGTYELTTDLDAKDLELDNGYGYSGTFFGVLNGNGHTIYNMTAPLFWGMTGGKVYDLTLHSPNVSGKASFVADIANGSSIVENVKVVNGTISSASTGSVGGIVGKLSAQSEITDCVLTNCSITGNNAVGGISGAFTQSTITNCALISCSVTGNNTVGGLVGDLQADSLVEKSVVVDTIITGTLSGNPNGTRGGGIAGWLNATATIRNCLIDIELMVPDKKGSGGIFGAPNNANAGTVTNCVVKVTGSDRYSIGGDAAALGRVTNVYQLSNNSVIQTGDSLSTINYYDSKYLVDTLGISKDYADVAEQFVNLFGGVLSLEVMEGYDSEKEIAYNNIMKLAPWLDSRAVISLGNGLTGDLAVKEIRSIYPMDSADKFVHVVDSSNTGSIENIRVLYEDKTFEIFAVTAVQPIGGIVDAYTINSIDLPYYFNKYIFDDTLGLAEKVEETASEYVYDTNISTVYTDSLVRQYKYIYENDVAAKLDTFAERLIASEYASLTANTALKSTLETKITGELPKLLYTYTYFKKNFGFEMGGVNIADLIFFDTEVLSSKLSLDAMVNKVASSNRGMTNAYSVFEGSIASATGITLYDQLELFLDLGGVTDYDAWLQSYSDCHIVSQPVLGYTLTTAEYTTWDNLTNPHRTGGNCNILALLTIPKEFQPQMAVVSTVGTVLFTDINVYYANPTEADLANFRASADRTGQLYARYFGTSLNYIPNGEDSLFRDLTYQYDTVQAYPGGSKYAGVALTENTSPLVMWLGEPVGKARTIGASAVSTGDHIFYGYNKALGNLGLFSHENAHSMDGTYFLAGNGRRGVYDVEFYTEGFFTEPGNEGLDDISINRVSQWGINEEQTAALNYERVDSPEELEDYYKDLFNTWYAFDAIAANAFTKGGEDLQWQAGKYAYYMSDPNDPWAEELEDIEAAKKVPYIGYWGKGLPLNNYDDLWENKIVYKGLGGVGSGYERPKFFEINWWMPTNDIGCTDANTFKLMGYDMLGYAGWEEGMIGWASGKFASDEVAIQGITGYSGMEEYKKARYTEALNQIADIPYFKDNELEAVVSHLFATQNPRSATPVAQIKAIVINTIKRVTDDFTDGTMYEMTENNSYKVSTAQELVDLINTNSMKKGIYIELENDLDFSEISGEDSYYAEHFIGIINGNGYTIKNLSKPLLKSSKFAMFYGITLEGSATKYLANEARYTLAYNCNFNTTGKLFEAAANDTNPYIFTVLNNQ